MLTLSAPVVLPSIVSIKLRDPTIRNEVLVISCAADAVDSNGSLYRSYTLTIEGQPQGDASAARATGLRVNAQPADLGDLLQPFGQDIPPPAEGQPTLYQQALGAMASSLSMSPLEQLLVATGLLPAGSVA